MPTYDYQCQECGTYHEIICSISSREDEVECPRCHGVAEQVILSAPGVMTGNMSNQTQDVAIGRDADRRWNGIHDRKAMRDKARKESGVQTITATGAGNEIVFRPVKKELNFVRQGNFKSTERED
jgi:putative FmdB family regulatory protein